MKEEAHQVCACLALPVHRNVINLPPGPIISRRKRRQEYDWWIIIWTCFCFCPSSPGHPGHPEHSETYRLVSPLSWSGEPYRHIRRISVPLGRPLAQGVNYAVWLLYSLTSDVALACKVGLTESNGEERRPVAIPTRRYSLWKSSSDDEEPHSYSNSKWETSSIGLQGVLWILLRSKEHP